MAIVDPNYLLTGDIEAWKCDHCKSIMYNVDADGYAIPGAPMPKFANADHNNVCSLCHAMFLAVDSTYFRKLNTERAEANKAARARAGL